MGATTSRALGKYHLIAEIARGGMGIVYLAMVSGPAGFNKLVVVKKLREAPELLEGGAFSFETKRAGLFSRLFSSREAEVAPVSKKQRDPEEERRLAEARALVEEELGTSPSRG